MTDSSIGDKETGRDIPPSGEDSVDSLPTDRSLGDLATRRAELQRRHYRVGSVLLGRYRITGELGQGGMGVVFRCFDEVGGIEVALKALPPELSHNSVEMEEVRENFRLVQGLAHPHIATVKQLEKDPDSGDYYLVMECVEGVNLRQWRRKDAGSGGVPPDRVSPILRQVAEALDFAHGQRIIHRDIKPSNVMIKADGTVKVLDFGLAAQIHTSLSRVSRVAQGTSGTGPYMAPEQWEGDYQDAATDQYALAVMTYELLSGRLPFENPDISVLREAVLKTPPRPIPGLDPKAWKALQVGLGKARDGRFPSCRQFVAALEGRAPARPVAARSRRRKAVLAVLLLAAAAFGGYWAYTNYWSDLSEQRDDSPEAAKPPSGHPPPPPIPVEEEVPEVPVPPEELEPPIPVGLGSVFISTEPPGAEVELGRHGLATSPATFRDVPSGEQGARIRLPDYEPVELVLDVPVDAFARTNVVLRRQRGRLDLATEPPDARIAIAGRDTGRRTPDILDLEVGDYAVTLSKPGYRPITTNLTVRADETLVEHGFVLARERGAIRITAEVPENARAHFQGLEKRIRIGSNPWKTVDSLPHTEEGLACEEHEARLEVTGFRVDAASRRVMVRDGETAETRFTLTPEPARLTVTANAPGAEIFDDSGRKLGSAGTAFEVPSLAALALVVRAAVHADGRVDIPGSSLPPGGAHRETVRLEEVRGPVAGDTRTVDLGGGVSLELVWIPPGRYMRGSTRAEQDTAIAAGASRDWVNRENPQDQVTISQGFWMGKYAVTQRKYQQLMGNNPAHFKNAGLDAPVESVTWHDAKAFCGKLQERLAGDMRGLTVRLPTEGEWEHACRAGTTTAFHYENDLDASMANFNGNYPFGNGRKGEYRGTTVRVGSFRPNAFGLYDMHGNVWEWCEDWFGPYPSGSVTDPTGSSSGLSRVLRGGSWTSRAGHCRSASRYCRDPDVRISNFGFRVVVVR